VVLKAQEDLKAPYPSRFLEKGKPQLAKQFERKKRKGNRGKRKEKTLTIKKGGGERGVGP
jgi:hypothetical protein